MASVGETLGTYRLVGELGAGAMGQVYVAEHTLLGRKAAIKVLVPELSQNAEVVNRFFNEARATSLIRHASIVECLDFGHHPDGYAFIVMEYLEGESLAARLRRVHRLQPDRAATIARQVASALAAAHAKGVIHRDLKPDNIFLVADAETSIGERAKVLDFGIAKLAGGGMAPGSLKTRTGALMGTPAYMSPEQCRGSGDVDEKTDVYALGCVLYEMACGRPPFLAEGFGEIIAAHLTVPPPSPRAFEPSVPVWLEGIALRALAKDPGDRYAGMKEFIEALDAALGSTTVQRTLGLSTDAGAAALETPTVAYERPSVPPAHTTFASAASEAAPSKTARRPIAVGVALLAVAAAAYGILRRDGSSHTPATTPPSDYALTVVCPGGGRVRSEPPGIDCGTACQAEFAPDSRVTLIPEPQAGFAFAGWTGSCRGTDACVVTMDRAHNVGGGFAKAAPAIVKLRIGSRPDGAEVFRALDGVRLGVTPLEVEIERAEGEAAFLLRRHGYREARATLRADRGGETTVTLSKTRVTRPKRKEEPEPWEKQEFDPAPAKRVRGAPLEPDF